MSSTADEHAPAHDDSFPSSGQDLGRLPYSFAVVGVQKSGTTTIAGTLNRHVNVCRAPRKEAHFFNDETVDWSAPDYERDYTVRRKARSHTHVGDYTPIYLYWPHALERMRAYRPDIPLVAVFRDPLERLFSQWVMMRSRKATRPDWPDFVQHFTEVPDEIPADVPLMRFKHESGVGRGLYGAQLERAFSVFGDRDQWLLLEFRQLLGEYDDTVDRLTDHVGLSRFRSKPPLENRYAGAELVVGTAPTADELARLAEHYRHDLAVFERLSGLDTTAWPTRLILDGRLDPAELAARFARRVG
jgi:hypothetical protein